MPVAGEGVICEDKGGEGGQKRKRGGIDPRRSQGGGMGTGPYPSSPLTAPFARREKRERGGGPSVSFAGGEGEGAAPDLLGFAPSLP